MGIFNWDETYSVKNQELDNQHKTWLAILNDFYEKAGENKPLETIQTLLDSAINYTEIHFKKEEEIMANAKYPELENHKNLHKIFKSKLMEYKEHFNKRDQPVTLKVTSEMRKWINHHIKEEDKKYVPYLK